MIYQPKKYYGFRFYSNRSCSYGSPHPVTGRYSIAGDVQVFRSVSDLNAWLNKETLGKECGNGGGERIKVTKKEARRLSLGMSLNDFEDTLKSAEFERYDMEELFNKAV